MKILLVYASVCVAASSAGLAGFGNSGGSQLNNIAGGNGGGYSDQRSGGGSGSINGGFGNGFAREVSSALSLFGGGGGQGTSGGGFGGGFSSGAVGGTRNSGNTFGEFLSGNGNGGASQQQNQQGGQVRRFVSVHVAPEESVSLEPRIIRAGGAPDTHYNIIFVKAPSASSQQQTEVVLPEQPQQKTLVYVLVKKPEEGQDNVKIRAPSPTKPAKPEVYFIRYKSDSDNGGGGGAAGNGGGVSGGNSNFANGNGGGFIGSSAGFGLSSSGGGGGSGLLGTSYGPPQNGGGSNGGYQ